MQPNIHPPNPEVAASVWEGITRWLGLLSEPAARPENPLDELKPPASSNQSGLLEGHDCKGQPVHFEISAEAYASEKPAALPRTAVGAQRGPLFRAFISYDNPLIKNAAETLTAGARTPEQKARHLLGWVRRTIAYDAAEGAAGRDYYRTPIETLYERSGDGEDSAFLYAALCRSLNIEVAILEAADHLMVGVAGRYKGSAASTGKTAYYVAETANVIHGQPVPWLEIGEAPRVYENASVQVHQLPVELELNERDYRRRRFSLKIPLDDFFHCRDYSGPRRLIRDRGAILRRFVTSEPCLNELALGLTRGAKTPEQKAQRLLNWVQKYVTYDSAEANADREYFRFPIETLYHGLGDCEDSTFLYAALCRAIGLDVALVLYPRHIAAAVCGSFSGSHYQYGKKKYFLAETTGGRSRIGSSNATAARQKATIYPL